MFFRTILAGILFIVLPGMVLAKKTINDPGRILIIEPVAMIDSIPSSKKPSETKPNDNNKPDVIKEVPKARRQLKPDVVAPEIKVKPVKVITPKIKVKIGL